MRSTTGIHFYAIEHLRALAAILVIFWHGFHTFGPMSYVPEFWLFSLLEEGYFGVSLFLVVSGFLFYTLTFDAEMNVRQFWLNRILRVFPLLFFWMVFAIAANKTDALQIFVVMTTLLNTGLPIGGWTVAVEFQIYLIFPFIMSRLRSIAATRGNHSLSAAGFLFCVMLLFMTLRALVWARSGTVHILAYYTVFGRIEEFLIGMICAMIYNRAGIRRAAFPLAGVGALGFTMFFHWFNRTGGYYNLRGEYPSSSLLWIFMPTILGAGAGALLLTYVISSARLQMLFPAWSQVTRPLTYLGEISYSMYFAHRIVVEAFGKVVPAYWGDLSNKPALASAIVFGAVLPVTVVISHFTFQLFEKPFLRMRSSYLLR